MAVKVSTNERVVCTQSFMCRPSTMYSPEIIHMSRASRSKIRRPTGPHDCAAQRPAITGSLLRPGLPIFRYSQCRSGSLTIG